jgi:hypothetical protein
LLVIMRFLEIGYQKLPKQSLQGVEYLVGGFMILDSVKT